jgi:ribosomal protein S18 acetylase RimI-like enzyme
MNLLDDHQIVLKEFDITHVTDIVKIHLQELPDSIFNLFGEKFISSLYLSILKVGWGFVLTSKINGEVIGFITASEKKSSILSHLSFKDIFLFLKNILLDKNNFNLLISALKSRILEKRLNNYSFPSRSVELSNFAVKNNYKGKGFGVILLRAFEKKSISLRYDLIFTRTHNSRLANFYLTNKSAKIAYRDRFGLFILLWKLN